MKKYLTFSELEKGDKFIAIPKIGDTPRALHHICKKVKIQKRDDGRENSVVLSSWIRRSIPKNMRVIRVA